MAGNSFGELFRITTFGESHGPAMGCIIDGCPPGLELSAADIQVELDRRRPGSSKYTSQRREPDQVQILSGVFEGKTTGTSIGLLVENTQQRSSDYDDIKHRIRPGHADFTYAKKYGIRDYRGGGRSSARETLNWVAAGAIAKKYLHQTFKLEVQGYVSQVGDITLSPVDLSFVNSNPFFCPEPDKVPVLEAFIDELRREGDSIGAEVCVLATGVPIGLGEPVFDKLDADIAKAMMAINAVKAVEIGDGRACITQRGSQHRDEIDPNGFLSNHAGGILGGISSGQYIAVRIAVKPAASIRVPGKSIDSKGQATEVITTGRHDPCVGLRAVPVAEAMLALVLMDHALRHRAQNKE